MVVRLSSGVRRFSVELPVEPLNLFVTSISRFNKMTVRGFLSKLGKKLKSNRFFHRKVKKSLLGRQGSVIGYTR